MAASPLPPSANPAASVSAGRSVTFNPNHQTVLPRSGSTGSLGNTAGSTGDIENLDGSIGDLNGTMSLRRQREAEARLAVPEMPPEKVYYAVKVFHLNKWTRRAALLIFISSVLATFVPQFVVYSPNSHTFGLLQECTGMSCLAANFTILQQHPGCKASCNDDSAFRTRIDAIAAMFWLGTIASVILGMVQYLHYARKYMIKLEGILVPTIVVFIVGLGCLIAGLAVFGTTFDIGYEESDCTFTNDGCLVYGTSSYIGVFAVVTFFLSGISGIFAGLCHSRRISKTGGFFTELFKKAPMEQLINMASKGTKNEDEADEKNKKNGNDDGDEELTDLNKLQPQQTAAFNAEESAPLKDADADTDEDTKNHEPAAESAALLVSQESRFYAGGHDGDLGSDEDEDDEDEQNDQDPEDAELNTEEKQRREMKKLRKLNKDQPQTPEDAAAARLREENNTLRSWQRSFNLGAIFFAIIATGFSMGAVLSPKWVHIGPTASSSALDRYSIGLIAQCHDVSCSAVNYGDLLINNTCGGTATELEARLAVSALFYLIAAVLCIPLFFSSSTMLGGCCASPLARKILTLITFVMTVTAVTLSMYTFDAWVNCDIPWCEAYLSTHKDNGSCEYGFMFGAALLSVCCSTILITMNVIQYCCRPCGYEDKERTEELRKRKKAEREQYTHVNERSGSPSQQLSPSTTNLDSAQHSDHAQLDANGNDDDDDSDDDDYHGAPPKVESTPRVVG